LAGLLADPGVQPYLREAGSRSRDCAGTILGQCGRDIA